MCRRVEIESKIVYALISCNLRFSMRLKKIKIFGFKSFADHTTLEFNEGITGVVGPNGCGKSNIADAFRWVLEKNQS